MGKDKLRRFAENLTFECLVQPRFRRGVRPGSCAQGALAQRFFHNDRPIVLELGCGKGEYTVALAERTPERNFIGIDIKGARMWRGAKTATERGMGNVGFLRTRIELIGSFSPRARWTRSGSPSPIRSSGPSGRAALTAPGFLAAYARMLAPGGTIHLKTDSKHLYAYTQAVIARFGLPCAEATDDLYGSGRADDVLSVRTAYEQRFLEMGLPITYTRFGLGDRTEFAPFAWEGDDAAGEGQRSGARPVAACGCGTELVRRRRAAGGAAAETGPGARTIADQMTEETTRTDRTVHAPGARRSRARPARRARCPSAPW